MKILHIVDSGGIYGKEQVIINLMKEQKELGIEPMLYVIGKPDLTVEVANNNLNAWFIPSASHLIKIVKNVQYDYDVIHLHGYKDGILITLQKLLRNINVPIVRTIHGYTSVNKSWFSRIHLYETVDKFLLRFCDKVVGVSDNMKTFKYVDTIVNNGIQPFLPDCKNIDKQLKVQYPDNFSIMCSARLSKEKNLESLIRSIPILQQRRDELPYRGLQEKLGIKLYIFGEGSERPVLEKIITDLNLQPEKKKLDEVYLMGFNKNARDHLRFVDFYIQPSYTEGTPISVLEAMCARRFTLVSNVGGMTNLIERRKNPNAWNGERAAKECGVTPEQIANSIIAYASDREAREKLTESAHSLFLSNYSSRAMAEGYLEVYNNISSGD